MCIVLRIQYSMYYTSVWPCIHLEVSQLGSDIGHISTGTQTQCKCSYKPGCLEVNVMADFVYTCNHII